MAEDQSSPLPIPKGTYNFDFDNLDAINPFQSKSKVGNSPPKNGNNNNELPKEISDDNFDENFDPFKPRGGLSNSPPTKLMNNNDGEKKVETLNDANSLTPPELEKPKKTTPKKKTPVKKSKSPSAKPVQELPEKLTEAPPNNHEPVDDEISFKGQVNADIEIKPNSEQSTPSPSKKETDKNIDDEPVKQSPEAKKTPSPKKNLKKPKSAVKNKTPPKAFTDMEEEIQIFAPKPPEKVDVPPDGTEITPDDSGVEMSGQSPSNKTVTESEVKNNSVVEDIFSPPPPLVESLPEALHAEVTTENVKANEEEGSGDDDDMFQDAQQDIGEIPIGMTASEDLRLSNHMAASLDAFHEFGAGEEGDMAEDNEGYIPATDAFADNANWEMLEKIGTNSSHVSSLGRESLYVAFDPYVQPIRPAAEVIPEKEEEVTPPSVNIRNNSSASSEKDLLLLNTPSPNTGKQKSKNHPASRKLHDQFVAKNVEADQYVDKLLLGNSPLAPTSTDNKEELNMSGNEQVVQLVQVMKYTQTEWNKMKQDLELKYQSELLNKEKEWSKKLADRDKKAAHEEEKHKKYQMGYEDMKAVIGEFEKTIAQLQAERQKSKQTIQELTKERDQGIEDLSSLETAFSDIHRRFEKAKNAVETFKKNEEVLKKCLEDCQGKVKRAESKLHEIKEQAEEKLEQAHNDMERIKKSSTTDMAKLEAALKKYEIKVKGLEQSLEQKKKENEELTSICDELIAKVEG